MKKFLLIALLSILFGNRASAQKQDTLRIRVMTYNLRFGELASLEQIAEHIKAFKPDFVALQEVDSKTFRERAPKQNGKDFITELGYRTEMYPLYGKSISYKDGYYGIGILSKHPYISVNKLMLPNPQGAEPRALLEGLFEVGKSDTIFFAATHLDVTDEKTCELQAQYITDYFKTSSYPVIIGGDFNAEPNSKVIKKIMARHWWDATDSALTFPAWEPKVKIDYLYARPQKGWRVVRTQAVHSLLSDHLPIITELEYVRE